MAPCIRVTGSIVTRVQARDNDTSAPYNTITYSIIGDGGVAGVFAINPSTGAITLLTGLSSLSQNMFRVGVSIPTNL